jgi:hypothetical protein
MTDKEQILAEVRRLKIELIDNGENTMFEQGRISAFEDMEVFIDSLQEEPVDAGLEEEIIRYIGFPEEVDEDISTTMVRNAARHFAKWSKKQAEIEIQARSIALAHGCPEEEL